MDELLNKIAELNNHWFIIQMADHLSSEDYRILDKIREEKTSLIAELKDKYGIDYYKEVK